MLRSEQLNSLQKSENAMHIQINMEKTKKIFIVLEIKTELRL